MKFRVIFLKKKYILYIFLGIIALLVILSLLLMKRTSTPTFNVLNDNKIIKADLTGDGKKDILYVKTENNKYYIEINSNEKSFYLEPNKTIKTVGTYCSYCPMKITLMDISRDKIPEIFIQSMQDNIQIQHIFMWNNGKFQDIFCGTNNLIGFWDCQNSRTPKFITGALKNNKLELTQYILIKNTLQSFPYNYKDTFMGKDSIVNFISYIESLPQGEASKPVDVYYPGLSGKDLEIIGKLSNENCTYSFMNGSFMDTKWNKTGEVSEVNWSLNFKGLSNSDKSKSKNYNIVLTLKYCEGAEEKFYYKITSMKLN